MVIFKINKGNKKMNLKHIKAILQVNPNVFQIMKTDSCYTAKMDFELVEINQQLGIYSVIGKMNFNQVMKLNLLKIKSINSGSTYQKHFFKLIKE
jgi:hypothetical protein